MARVSTTAINIVFAAQMRKSHIAEPNYRPLFFLIICINSKKSDSDMGNKAMKIPEMNHKYKLVVLFCKQLHFVYIHVAHLLQTTRTAQLNCIFIHRCIPDGEEY